MLSVVRRDDKTFTFYFYDEDGDPINLTGATLFTSVKQNVDDADAVAKISTTLTVETPPTDGRATWNIVPADTQYLSGIYYWDVQMKSAAGKITTLIRDMLEVLPDVTIRTS